MIALAPFAMIVSKPTNSIVRRTPCRSAASPPHERFADVTPISLRRDRPLQRLVRQPSREYS
jgi:hypothetical protein